MRTDSLFIAGLGACLPEPVSAADAIALGRYDADEQELAGWISTRVAGEVPGPDLAVAAGREAMDRSGHPPEEVDLLIHASTYHQGPDAWSPQHYVQRCTIGGQAPAMEIRQGCNGMVGGMELGACYLAAVPGRTAVLITAGDNFGAPLIDRWRSITNVVLGDAGAAMVLSRRDGFARVLAVSSGSAPSLELLHRGDEQLYPPGCTVGRVVDLRARALQFAESDSATKLPEAELIGRFTGRVVRRALEEAGVDVGKISRVTHVNWGHERYLRRTLAPLGFETGQGTLDFSRRVGHLGACDQVVGLYHLIDTEAVGPGDLVMMIGVGAGVSIACAIVEILERPRPTASVQPG